MAPLCFLLKMPQCLHVQAGVHPFDGVLQTVVKPVWNIPVGGTAYWQVSLRGCNADQYAWELLRVLCKQPREICFFTIPTNIVCFWSL